ncbi:hypothetical protein ABHF91_09690 [Pseudaeromonas sp. ZJS20]|uniref:hypothetical protein n=1 Tax=Pseudaeromonas aegiceratis TaxID=3153928 RepID=UPI00390CD077
MYALISVVRVEHFNAQQTKDIVAPLPLHAAIMLGHAIGAKLSAPVSHVGLVLHQAAVECEHFNADGKISTSFSSKRGACAFMVDSGRSDHGGGYASSATGPSGMAYQANVNASGAFSIILYFDEKYATKESIETVLANARLAGGNITGWSAVETFESWDDLLSRLRPGFFVLDASHQVQSSLEEGLHIVDALFNRRDSGYFCPVAVGYSLLTDKSNTCRGIRVPQPQGKSGITVVGHAFAEAVVGLIQLRHLSSFRVKNNPPENESELGQEATLEPGDEYIDDDEYEYESFDEVEDEEFDDDAKLVIDPNDVLWTYGWSQDKTTFLIQQK